MTNLNQQIGSKLLESFEQSRNQFLNQDELHPLLEQFKSLVEQIDLQKITGDFKSEIENNITGWWTNSEKDVDLNTPVLAILFTYRGLEDKEPEALVYGISATREPLKTQVEPYLLDSHDYVDGYYAMPGVKLDLCKSFHQFQWQNLESAGYENLDLYDYPGRHDLYDTYNFAIRYCIHKSLIELHKESKLSNINSSRPLHFLIQQYDEHVTLVLLME